jgi:hypothetical protein
MGLDPVKVYSISCQVHTDLCRKFGVTSYPRVLLLSPGKSTVDAAVRISIKRLHPFIVLNRLGVQVDHLPWGGDEDAALTKQNSLQKRKATTSGKVMNRTKQNVFEDAHLSFDYTLRHGIYTTEGALSGNYKTAFNNWLELLKMSLPPGWTARKVINAILDDFPTATSSKEHLLRIIERFPTPKKEWSESCTKGVPGMGYTCGLWYLLHIATVGVVEFNLMVESDQNELAITTGHAADVIRDFIAYFFGCEACRTHFLADYGACMQDRCNRLSSEYGEQLPQWTQLPVWLLETHNAVNVRIRNEKVDTERRSATLNMADVQWPVRRNCQACWRDDGSLDHNATYQYLRIEYW